VSASSAFLVSQHLAGLIVRDFAPRVQFYASQEWDQPLSGSCALALAAHELHAVTFQAYRQYCEAMRLPCESSLPADDACCSGQTVNALLHDLALWMCLWTEASCLRHMPEALWFLFWVIKHHYKWQPFVASSPLASALARMAVPSDIPACDTPTCDSPFLASALQTRQHLAGGIAGDGQHLQVPALTSATGLTAVELAYDTAAAPCGSCDVCSVMERSRTTGSELKLDTLASIASHAKAAGCLAACSHVVAAAAPGNACPHEMALDFVLWGDGGQFLARIIQPFFSCVARESARALRV
jgi:hypothetical protein